MKNSSFVLTYLLFVVAQMLLTNYFHVTPFIMLTILPTMVLCIPTKIDSVVAMLIAFASGLAIDYLVEGSLGINALAIVPVAFLRKPLIDAICGGEPFEQKENITMKKYGIAKISLAIIIVQAVFNAIYVLADCAGTRPFSFIALRFALSVLASYLVSLIIVNPLTYDDRR